MDRFLLPKPAKIPRLEDSASTSSNILEEAADVPVSNSDESMSMNVNDVSSASELEESVELANMARGDGGPGAAANISASEASGPRPPPPENDLSQQPVDGPRQPVRRFPLTNFGHQQRRFNRAWYGQYNWLEYSVMKDSAFCFSCRHFLTRAHGFHIEDAFTVTGFKNWKKATDAFNAHNVSSAHKFSMEAWCSFKQREEGSNLGKLFVLL